MPVLVRHGKDPSFCSQSVRKPPRVSQRRRHDQTLSDLPALWKMPSAEQVWKQEAIAIIQARDEGFLDSLWAVQYGATTHMLVVSL